MTIQEAYIVDAVRTPVTKAPRGAFHTTRPDDLLAHCLQALLARNPTVDPALIEDAVIGCAMPEGEQGLEIARNAVLLAGLPQSVPGVVVNRYCASGLQAVAQAADRIRLGDAEVMIAGGCESMSMVPMPGARLAANLRFAEDKSLRGLLYGMGITAEKVAERWNIDRASQDAFGAESQRRALAAIQQGEFKDEIVPYTVREQRVNGAGQLVVQEQVVDTDEGPRASDPSAMAKLRTAFRQDGSVTAANSSQMSDGAGAVLIVSERILKQYNLTPMARFVSYRVTGCSPEIMGIGPIKAIPAALQAAGISQDQLDWIELNEAFAAQSLAVINELGLDTDKINPLGGAIALGHPLGATGAIRTATLLHGLRRRQQRYGMVTMCVGGGMGAAGVFERL